MACHKEMQSCLAAGASPSDHREGRSASSVERGKSVGKRVGSS